MSQSYLKRISLPAIAAGAIKQYLFDSNELKGGIRKYKYYNKISVVNGDDIDLELQLDLGKAFPVPAGGILELNNLRYDGFNIKNTHATEALVADKAIVMVEVIVGGEK